MGAWDHGPFDNDSALDFVGDLAKGPADGVTAGLRAAMEEVVTSTDYVEMPEMSAALAAACLVAARTDPSVPLGVVAKEYLDGLAFDADDELRALAARVFVRADDPADNEWHYLWADAGALDATGRAHAPYRRVLTGPA